MYCSSKIIAYKENLQKETESEMGHIAAGFGSDDDDDEDYSGLSFDEIVRRVKEKGEREKYSEAKVTDLLTKIVMEGFVWYHVAKPRREYLWSKKNGEFADPLGQIMNAARRGIKRPRSQCRGEEEGEEKKEEKRPRELTMEKKPTKKSNVEKLQEAKKKKKTKRFNLAALGLEPPPGLPEDLQRLIEEKSGTDTTLVMMKQLFETDYSKHHDRFSMPLSQMREGVKFLTEAERQLLDKSQVNKKVYVPVNLLQPGFDHKEKRGLALRRWESNCVCYNITTKWHEVVQNNNLKVEDILQVWSFRVGEDLWFAMVKVMDREEARSRAMAAAQRDQQENGDGAATISSHSEGDKAMEEAVEEQEDGDGATAKAGGQEQQH